MRTGLSAGGHYNREVEDLANRSVREHVVLVLHRVVVARKLEQADLVVNHEQRRIVLVKAFPCKSYDPLC